MAVAAYNSQVLITAQPSNSLTNEATTDAGDHQNYTISNSAKRYLDINTAVTVQVEHDEVQQVSLTGGPTGGTFTLSFGGNTTSAIAYNASASTVQSALTALSSIGSGNLTASGSNGGPWTVEFTNSLGNASQALITGNGGSLTGGSSPNVSISRVQAGSTWATVSASTYTLKYVGGIVVFNSANAQGTSVRFASGAYYSYSTLAQAHTAEFAGKCAAINTTPFNSSGVETYTPGLMSGTIKFSKWWESITRVQSLENRDLLVVSFVTPPGNRYEGYVYATDCGIKADPKGAVDEDLTLQLTNQFFSN